MAYSSFLVQCYPRPEVVRVFETGDSVNVWLDTENRVETFPTAMVTHEENP